MNPITPTPNDIQGVLSILELVSDPKAQKEALERLQATSSEVFDGLRKQADNMTALAEKESLLNTKEVQLGQREAQVATREQNVEILESQHAARLAALRAAVG